MTLVLLVEDNAHNREVYVKILQHGGYDVAVAGDGEAGLLIARELRPAAVLMDVSVPVIDGLEVTRRLKRDPTTAGIPIIGLSAHALPEDVEEGLSAGMDEYLCKPVRPLEVLAAIRRWIGDAAAPA